MNASAGLLGWFDSHAFHHRLKVTSQGSAASTFSQDLSFRL